MVQSDLLCSLCFSAWLLLQRGKTWTLCTPLSGSSALRNCAENLGENCTRVFSVIICCLRIHHAFTTLQVRHNIVVLQVGFQGLEQGVHHGGSLQPCIVLRHQLISCACCMHQLQLTRNAMHSIHMVCGALSCSFACVLHVWPTHHASNDLSPSLAELVHHAS